MADQGPVELARQQEVNVNLTFKAGLEMQLKYDWKDIYKIYRGQQKCKSFDM